MKKSRLLIVDDEPDMLTGLTRTLERQMVDLGVITVDNGLDAIATIQQKSFDVALLDICMPEMSGVELLERLTAEDPELTVIMMTAFGTIETAVEAMKKGAYDFITKPFEKDSLARTINKALERNRLVRENTSLRKIICEQGPLSGFIGQSRPMLNFCNQIKMIAQSNYTVLIRGESGTGKELAAHALHNLSTRKNKKCIVVNCPAIPEHLLESELFGHKRGAFTGADRDQKGLFAEADGGTICLDEIGDISISVQIKLLRVLEEQEIKPLGSVKTQKTDVRIITMTNQNLESKISQRTFREDLFHRLNIVNIHTPSLAEIREDIPLLVDHFLKKICCELDIPEKQFSKAAILKLKGAAWPGNVRELQNVIRQVVIFSTSTVIEENELEKLSSSKQFIERREGWEFDLSNRAIEPYKIAKERLVQDFTDGYISILLDKTNGNVTKAADISGLSRTALHRIIARARNKH